MTTKKEKILEAAMELFQERGYEKTSVSQIVGRAGMAQGTFYLYFKSKNALVSAIASKIFEEQLEVITGTYDPQNGELSSLLQTLVEATFSVTQKHRDVITFLYSGFAYDQSFSTWEEIYRPYYTWLENALQSILPQTEVSLPHLANFIIGLVEHGAETCYMSGLPDSEIKSYRKNLLVFLHASVNAMKPSVER